MCVCKGSGTILNERLDGSLVVPPRSHSIPSYALSTRQNLSSPPGTVNGQAGDCRAELKTSLSLQPSWKPFLSFGLKGRI